MKRFICLATLLVVASSISGARAAEQVLACDFDVKAKHVTGDASVTLVDGAVKRIELNLMTRGERGRPGYGCTIDSTRGEKDSRWSEEAGATLIDNASPFNESAPDRVKVTVGKHVSIDLEQTQSLGRCGVGAELPKAVVIRAQTKICRVWMGEF